MIYILSEPFISVCWYICHRMCMEVRGQFSDLILFAHYMAVRDQTETIRLGVGNTYIYWTLLLSHMIHLRKLSLTLGVYFRYGLLPCLVYLDHHNNHVKKMCQHKSMVSTASLNFIALSGNLGHSVFTPKMSTRNANFKQWSLDLFIWGCMCRGCLWTLVDNL